MFPKFYMDNLSLNENKFEIQTNIRNYAVITPPFRYLLHDKRPDEPIYFGRQFKSTSPKVYMSGGAGYVLRSAALKVDLLTILWNLCVNI